MRVDAVLELALGLDNGGGEVRVDMVAAGVLLHRIAVRERVEVLALEGFGREGQVQREREEEGGAHKGVEVLVAQRTARCLDAFEKIRSFQSESLPFLSFLPCPG